MDAIGKQTDALTRLKNVQRRIGELAHENEWFADEMRSAFNLVLFSRLKHAKQQQVPHKWKQRSIRKLLKQGMLRDRDLKCLKNCAVYSFEGLCPIELVDRLRDYSETDLPQELEREAAAAAYEAFMRIDRYQSVDLDTAHELAADKRAALKAGTHVWYLWEVCLPHVEWQLPELPDYSKIEYLRELTDDEYLKAAMFLLGGLADANASRLIVPDPQLGDNLEGLIPWEFWQNRVPCKKDHKGKPTRELDADKLSPDLAEEMLNFVERWANGEAVIRGKSLIAEASSFSPNPLATLQPTAGVDEPDALDQSAVLAAKNHNALLGVGSSGNPVPQTPPGSVALTADQESILTVLGKTPTKCMTVIDTSSAGTIRNRETVGRLLRELATFGMVYKPHGKHKGYALTEEGRKRLTLITPT